MKKQILSAALAVMGAIACAAPSAKTADVQMIPVSDLGSFLWGGLEQKVVNKELTVATSPKCEAYAVITLNGLNVPNPNLQKNWEKGFIVFEIKVIDEKKPLGALKIALTAGVPKSWKTFFSTPYKVITPYIGKDFKGKDFKLVKVPLKLFVWPKEDKHNITMMAIQFDGSGKTSGGYVLRNLRFEFPAK